MSSKSYDINQPILVVIRRGRGNRGYTVAPVDSPTDIAACADAEQIGDAIVEMLEDKEQPRVDIDILMRAAEGDLEEEGEEEEGGQDLEETDEDDEDGDDEDEDEPWYKSSDPADALIINILSGAAKKARELSRPSRRRRGRGRGRRRTKRS